MQPYFFPYIGYFQLVSAVDAFVLYDDVAYIKQGWINRNKILLDDKPHVFTVPLKNASSFVTIAETEINRPLYESWRIKFLKTLTQAYKKAPYFNPVNELIEAILAADAATIGDLAVTSVSSTCQYLRLSTRLIKTATHYANYSLKAQERIVDICKREHASEYINAKGGKELYSKKDFEEAGIALSFIRSGEIKYQQFGDDFVPWLSIIDVMMFDSTDKIRQLLAMYTLE
jgi:hypothetical protein